jgi:hypothetical protein
MSKEKKPGVWLKSKQSEPTEYPLEQAKNLLEIAQVRREAGMKDEDNWQFLEKENAKNYTYQDGKINAVADAGPTKSTTQQGDSSIR